MADGFMWTLGAILAISVVAMGTAILFLCVHGVNAILLQWRYFKAHGCFDYYVTFYWTLTRWKVRRRNGKAAK